MPVDAPSLDLPNAQWPAAWANSAQPEPPAELPSAGSPEWKPLRIHRRAGGEIAGTFQPGWARIRWRAAALVVDFAFAATRASNRARRLNERTHLLGDVAEIFLQWTAADRYIEVHVTPENQRLQLAWSSDALARVRRGSLALEDFAVADPAWVASHARVAGTFWSGRVVVPAATLLGRGAELKPGLPLLAAVCRYDYSAGEPPVLSATCDFDSQPFHTRASWDRLLLLPSE